MGLRLLQLHSLLDLQRHAAAWDDLWRRSQSSSPTGQAAAIVAWCEQFAPRAPFRALLVEQDGRLAAGLPLIVKRLAGVTPAGRLPANEWLGCGDLLLDPACAAAAPAALAGALKLLPCSLLSLDAVPLTAPSWTALLAALQHAGMRFAVHPRFEIGYIQRAASWEAYWQSLSSSHQKKIGKSLRRLEKQGPVELDTHDEFGGDVSAVLRQAFAIEDRNWKGRAGTSVLRTPGMLPFLLRQAELLAAAGQLRVSFLRCGAQPIAFACGWQAKGVYHSYKIGYDEAFASFGPGHLLRHQLVQQLYADPTWTGFDCMGLLNEAVAKWTTGSYPLSRLTVAPRGGVGSALVHAYEHWWPHVRELRARWTALECKPAEKQGEEVTG